MSDIKNKLKIILINLLILLILIVIIEVIFGYWFKNKFSEKLAAERNVSRIYRFDFENYKGTSNYTRDNFGFRVPNLNFNSIDADIVFVGGSTVNQKFLNYKDTIVGILDSNFKDLKIINAGIDGMSLLGHINSFDQWFDKIEDFNPKYYIFYLGINDGRNLSEKNETRPVDKLKESSKKANLREYIESNSFFYTKLRLLKTYLYLKTDNQIFTNNINLKTVVYKERNSNKFITYEQFENEQNEIVVNSNIIRLVEKVSFEVKNRNAIPIYITQTAGNGMDKNLYTVANSIMQHCSDNNVYCINLAKNASLQYEDFYDGLHLNPKGSKKASSYIFKELQKIIN